MATPGGTRIAYAARDVPDMRSAFTKLVIAVLLLAVPLQAFSLERDSALCALDTIVTGASVDLSNPPSGRSSFEQEPDSRVKFGPCCEPPPTWGMLALVDALTLFAATEKAASQSVTPVLFFPEQPLRPPRR
jgi:hypothetical protein